MREVNYIENLLEGTVEWHCTPVLNDFSPKEIIPLLKYALLTRRNIKPQGIRIIKKKKVKPSILRLSSSSDSRGTLN